MKKGLLLLGFIALAWLAFAFVPGEQVSASDLGNYLKGVTPVGYAYDEPGSIGTGHGGCLDCKGQSVGWKKNTHLENAVGITGTTAGTTPEDGDVTITGIGWISSAHARSQDIGSSARNYYCGWCHSPGDPGVTNDDTEAKGFKRKGLSQGVSCKGCHPTNDINKAYDSRYGNLQPGTDYTDVTNWELVPRDSEGEYKGKESNNQCLFCHGVRHGFAVDLHENMVKKGDLRCFDCHMPVFSTTSFGRHEVAHNMKVAANENPESCTPCHSFSKKDMIAKVAKLMGGHTQKKQGLPSN